MVDSILDSIVLLGLIVATIAWGYLGYTILFL